MLQSENMNAFWSYFEKTLSENQIYVQLIEKTDLIDTHREMIDEKKGIWKTQVSDTGRQARVYKINDDLGMKVLEPDCSHGPFDSVPILVTIANSVMSLCDSVSLDITAFQNLSMLQMEIDRLSNGSPDDDNVTIRV